MTPINTRSTGAGDQTFRTGTGYSTSPLAETAIARDIEADDQGSMLTTDDEDSETMTVRPGNGSEPGTNPHSLAGSYRRPSFFTTVSHATVIPYSADQRLSRGERDEVIEEERRLLSDNRVISDGPRSSGKSLPQKITGFWSNRFSATPTTPATEPVSRRQSVDVPTEATSLLRQLNGAVDQPTNPDEIDRKWEEAVAAGRIQTTWQREALVIGQYAAPLVLTFLLQYSLTVASIFTVGHLGKRELGAVSLASMSVNITGYAVYQGLATSLDTLCAQAYGSGKKKLVGLQMQRMVIFLWACTIPIALFWFFADRILMKIVPDPGVANLAGLYLKVVIVGAPGYAAFESGKRYMQAQGLFSASLYILLICAPLNALMNWLFVWHFGWGFVGAPIAVATTDILMPLLLCFYVYFITGSECWNGLTKRALTNWLPMIQLALPGLVMVEAECLAFEVLTLASSYLGTDALAAQSVLSTLGSITFQIPFPLSIASSTRVANLIGSTLVDSARTCAKVSFTLAAVVGILNVLLLSTLRFYLPRLFSSDEQVNELVAHVLPLCAAFQLFDAVAANCNGLLRGLGRQAIGGWVQLFCYYAVAMPISFGTTFGLDWGLYGLWSGVAIALGLVSLIEGIFLRRTDWRKAVVDAIQRNDMA